jgi:anthranilate/para-aminobenzoate synthase component I/anthranilate/para-aminobenzoate synthase component II
MAVARAILICTVRDHPEQDNNRTTSTTTLFIDCHNMSSTRTSRGGEMIRTQRIRRTERNNRAVVTMNSQQQTQQLGSNNTDTDTDIDLEHHVPVLVPTHEVDDGNDGGSVVCRRRSNNNHNSAYRWTRIRRQQQSQRLTSSLLQSCRYNWNIILFHHWGVLLMLALVASLHYGEHVEQAEAFSLNLNVNPFLPHNTHSRRARTTNNGARSVLLRGLPLPSSSVTPLFLFRQHNEDAPTSGADFSIATPNNNYRDTSSPSVSLQLPEPQPLPLLLSTNSVPPFKLPLTLLLIDNYDSYTYNLYQHLCQMVDRVIVVPNDIVDLAYKSHSHIHVEKKDNDDDEKQQQEVQDYQATWERVQDYLKENHASSSSSSSSSLHVHIDGIIVSPGPGSPMVSKDVGICAAAILANPFLPVLGVCLGHQLLAHLYPGASVTYASEPMHGRISQVQTTVNSMMDQNSNNHEDDVTEMQSAAQQVLFQSLGDSFNVTRYHSLSVQLDDDALSSSSSSSPKVVPLAYTSTMSLSCSKSEECMALAIRHRPHLGVQFHPESVGTTYGKHMLWNWCHFVQQHNKSQSQSQSVPLPPYKKAFTWDNTVIASSNVANVELPSLMMPQVAAPEQERAKVQINSNSVADDQDETETTTTPFQSSASATTSKYQILIQKLDDILTIPLSSSASSGGTTTSTAAGAATTLLTSQEIHQGLYGQHDCSFWLDSSSSSSDMANNARFSIVGAMDMDRGGVIDALKQETTTMTSTTYSSSSNTIQHSGALSHMVEYFGAAINPSTSKKNDNDSSDSDKHVRVLRPDGSTSQYNNVDILSFLQQSLFPQQCCSTGSRSSSSSVPAPLVTEDEILFVDDNHGDSGNLLNTKERRTGSGSVDEDELPFSYRGGYVGFLGYEVRHDSTRLLLAENTDDENNEKRRNAGGDGGGAVPYCEINRHTQETEQSSSSLHSSSNDNIKINSNNNTSNNIPDAAFVFADRSLVCDHATGSVYLLAYADNANNNNKSSRDFHADEAEENASPNPGHGLHPTGDSRESVLQWMTQMRQALRELQEEKEAQRGRSEQEATATADNSHLDPPSSSTSTRTHTFPIPPFLPTLVPRRSKDTYLNDIAQCHEYIRQGESYELCLTNHFELDTVMKRSELELELDSIQENAQDATSNVGTSTTSSTDASPLSPSLRVDPYDIYKELRTANPAPFAAFLRLDPNRRLLMQQRQARSTSTSSAGEVTAKSEHDHEHTHNSSTNIGTSMALCSSSPERFLSLGQGGVLESKPIKGTAKRGSTPEEDLVLSQELQQSEKNQAENLMIVDLVRNDFGRICEVGSVHVPAGKLCAIESYATVHQLVSTVRGTLLQRQDVAYNGNGSGKDGAGADADGTAKAADATTTTTAIDALVAAFPGGSMTGAPKKRTLDLLEHLEQGAPRGPYSGCVGFISPTNVMDMNIVIRTAVVTPSKRVGTGSSSGTSGCGAADEDQGMKILVGAGGAITYLSELEEEYNEMLLKTRVVDQAVTTVLHRAWEKAQLQQRRQASNNDPQRTTTTGSSFITTEDGAAATEKVVASPFVDGHPSSRATHKA